MGIMLVVVGTLVGLVSFIWIAITAFHEEITWGLVCLLIPFAFLVFVVVHFDKVKNAFFLFLASPVLVSIGIMLSSLT